MTVQQHTATVQPYIFFDGKCEEALDFYKRLIARIELSDVSSAFAMEQIKYTTSLPLDYASE